MVIAAFLFPGIPLDDILFLVSTLFSQIIQTPDTALRGFGTLHLAPDLLMMFSGLLSILITIVPPLVAVIVGARLGDSGRISFFAWFLTSVISSVVFLLLVIFSPGVSPALGGIWLSLILSYELFGAILYFIVPGIVNGFFYGCISFLICKV